MAKEQQRLLPPKPPEKQVPRPKPAVPQAATTNEMNEIMKTAITDEQCIPEDVPLKEAIASLMEGIENPLKTELTRDVLRAWRAIDNGVTAKTAQSRTKYWRQWQSYATAWGKNAFLSDAAPIEKGIILTAFAARVRTGFYGRGSQVRVPSVSEALAAISKTIELAGQPSPVYRFEETYILPVQRCIEGMRREDPPSTPQLALPVAVPIQSFTTAQGSSDHRLHATADLSIIAFFYLLRVGEYTAPRQAKRNGRNVRATRTVQFRVQDIGFWKTQKQLDRNSDLHTLLQADAATMKISNQKNGRMGQTIHHDSFDQDHSPVKALARRVHHILSNNDGDDSALICMYKKGNEMKAVTPNDMITSIRTSVKDLKLDEAGIDPDIVGVHSLRAGGAMSLKLHGKSDTTIMKQGRWSGLTFLQYIHNQIGHLSKDLSTTMATAIPFLNIAAIQPPTQHAPALNN